MGLLSLFQFSAKSGTAGSVSDLADAVQQARVRARQRLIGAAVLLILGIIVFPLLFETQPRPVAIDIPIEIPRRENAAPLTLPPRTSASLPVPGTSEIPHAIVESAQDAGREVPPLANSLFPLPPPSAGTWVPLPALPEPHAVSTQPQQTQQPESSAGVDRSGRFVLQAGAFSDNAAAKDIRTKLDKMGLKTFVQTADTPEGKRIRVRVGPFSSREEAEKVLARVKAGGLSAVVLAV